VFIAAVAAIAAEARDVDTAEHALAVLCRDGLDQLLRGSTWLVTLFAVVEAAALVNDRDIADEAYALLEPYESLPTVAAIGACCFGSTARTLGIAARTAGRVDDAVRHLECAVAENQRLGNLPMTAIARADLAETLLARGTPGDRKRAADLLTRALVAADKHGLTGRIAGWRQAAARLDEPAPSDSPGTLERRDNVWLIAFGDEHAQVAATTGMKYLARLLASPRTDITVSDLAGVAHADAPQQVFDATALREIRRQVSELESEIDDAWSAGNQAKAEALQHDLDAVVAHLRSGVVPGGRSRRFDDASERARTSVQKAIRRGIVAISRDCPRLAAMLASSVRTGYSCCYEPVPGAPNRWDVRP
jgi:hypothetical protein